MARPWHMPLILLLIVTPLTSPIQDQSRYPSMRIYQDIPKTQSYMPQALRFAVKEYNQASEDTNIYKVVQVIQAQEKVTSSLRYHMTIKLGRTICRKSLTDHVHCPIEENSSWRKYINCSLEVFALPWLNRYSLMNWNCSDT
ncbi:cystatin-like isoform X3 [Phascolarctos cinereus]|uniref:Cystatin-like isoform X1 n=1 Tax=Phascolarctos cinereus TaxID=38626 RepID=A0A6P5KDU0_PHACI|nr:cystatin-like isoform X1 [Phascolarctos cinereus]